MAEISEILGALKGIGYDEEYKKSEIIYIKELLKEKRKRVFNKEDKKTLEIIDDILEDNYIDNREKKVLNDMYEANFSGDCCSKKYKVANDIYDEFYGIVNGILSDGGVNYLEIINLKV